MDLALKDQVPMRRHLTKTILVEAADNIQELMRRPNLIIKMDLAVVSAVRIIQVLMRKPSRTTKMGMVV